MTTRRATTTATTAPARPRRRRRTRRRRRRGGGFRELYLGIVTEACGEELDGIRRDEQLDPRGLASLIDALEFGAETFDATDASLALRSFAPAAATADADDDDEDAGEDDDAAAADGPPLLRAARELRSTRAARRASQLF